MPLGVATECIPSRLYLMIKGLLFRIVPIWVGRPNPVAPTKSFLIQSTHTLIMIACGGVSKLQHLNEETQPKTLFEVILNHEEQCTIHRKGKPVPAGWRLAGETGDKEECLAYIKAVWTDMTPLSLRRSHTRASEPASDLPATGSTD